MKGGDVVDQLERLRLIDGLIPERIQCDNGSVFISKEVDWWAYENGVTLDFPDLENLQIIHTLKVLMGNFVMNVCRSIGSFLWMTPKKK
jgi:hypothetical protein